MWSVTGSIVEPGFSCPLVPQERDAPMADVTIELLRTHFRQLRLPTMGQEFEQLAHDAAAANQTFVQFLLGLTEIELETRAANAVATRIKNAELPVLKDFDTYDFSVLPQLSKPKVLELSRCEWIEHKHNCCLVGSHGTARRTRRGLGPGGVSCRSAGALLHGGGVGQQVGGGAKAVHPGPIPGPTGASSS